MERPRIRILLADDDADDRVLFQSIYASRNDIEMLPAVVNGSDVIRKLDSCEDDADLPDLIILDQNMPLLTGKQTLGILKSTSRYAHIPICIYSTYVDQVLAGECIRMGAATVVSKPITENEYQEMLDTFLSTVLTH